MKSKVALDAVEWMPLSFALFLQFGTYLLRGQTHRVPRNGVAATIIDYSLSRLSLPLAAEEHAALFNDLSTDEGLFNAVGDYQFDVYRHMRQKLR